MGLRLYLSQLIDLNLPHKGFYPLTCPATCPPGSRAAAVKSCIQFSSIFNLPGGWWPRSFLIGFYF